MRVCSQTTECSARSVSRIFEVYTARSSLLSYTSTLSHRPSASIAAKFGRSTNVSIARPKTPSGIYERCFTSLFRWVLYGSAVHTKAHLQPYSWDYFYSGLLFAFSASVWDVRTGRSTHTLAGHHGEISSTQFSYSSDLCISGSIDRTCKVMFALSWGTVLQ